MVMTDALVQQRGRADADCACECISGLKATSGDRLSSLEQQIAEATDALHTVSDVRKASGWTGSMVFRLTPSIIQSRHPTTMESAGRKE